MEGFGLGCSRDSEHDLSALSDGLEGESQTLVGIIRQRIVIRNDQTTIRGMEGLGTWEQRCSMAIWAES
jgi:hypothetical protein